MGFKRKDCTPCEEKTKELIGYVVTTQLICGFVFANVNTGFHT